MEFNRIRHEFEPVFDKKSEILILGSLPSVKSRENGFYYGHPQNRFWKVLAEIFEEKISLSIDDKKAFLLKNKIALWDVISECDIIGSSDSSIKNAVPNDINLILNAANIKRIYANGNKTYELYMKFCREETGRDVIKLPSTSSANASYNIQRLINEWKKIR